MTAYQKQCLLAYLGYDCGEIDGVWGQQSQTAAAAFQADHGLEADGIFGEQTRKKILEVISGGWWPQIRYFGREEFACKCGRCGGFPAEPEEKLVRLAETVRAHFGAPVTVSSGVRCPIHNLAVGGVANSRHLSGKAMDFRVQGKSASEVLRYVNQINDIRYAYAIDAQFIHMDVE